MKTLKNIKEGFFGNVGVAGAGYVQLIEQYRKQKGLRLNAVPIRAVLYMLYKNNLISETALREVYRTDLRNIMTPCNSEYNADFKPSEFRKTPSVGIIASDKSISYIFPYISTMAGTKNYTDDIKELLDYLGIKYVEGNESTSTRANKSARFNFIKPILNGHEIDTSNLAAVAEIGKKTSKITPGDGRPDTVEKLLSSPDIVTYFKQVGISKATHAAGAFIDYLDEVGHVNLIFDLKEKINIARIYSTNAGRRLANWTVTYIPSSRRKYGGYSEPKVTRLRAYIYANKIHYKEKDVAFIYASNYSGKDCSSDVCRLFEFLGIKTYVHKVPHAGVWVEVPNSIIND